MATALANVCSAVDKLARRRSESSSSGSSAAASDVTAGKKKSVERSEAPEPSSPNQQFTRGCTASHIATHMARSAIVDKPVAGSAA